MILILTNEGECKELLQIFVRSHEPLSNVRWLHFISGLSTFYYSPNTSPLDSNNVYSYIKLFYK